MKRIPAIKSLMTAFPYSMNSGQSIEEALSFFERHEIEHLPVTNGSELTGVISKREVSLYLLDEKNSIRDEVGKIPVRELITVDLNARLDQVLIEMAANHCEAVLITRFDRLVGIFTFSDVCRSYVSYLNEQFKPPSGHDAA